MTSTLSKTLPFIAIASALVLAALAALGYSAQVGQVMPIFGIILPILSGGGLINAAIERGSNLSANYQPVANQLKQTIQEAMAQYKSGDKNPIDYAPLATQIAQVVRNEIAAVRADFTNLQNQNWSGTTSGNAQMTSSDPIMAGPVTAVATNMTPLRQAIDLVSSIRGTVTKPITPEEGINAATAFDQPETQEIKDCNSPNELAQLIVDKSWDKDTAQKSVILWYYFHQTLPVTPKA